MASPMPWVEPVTMMILSLRRMGKRSQNSEFRSPLTLPSPPSTGARGEEEEESQSFSGRVWELPAEADSAAGEEVSASGADDGTGEVGDGAVVGAVVAAVAVIAVGTAGVGCAVEGIFVFGIEQGAADFLGDEGFVAVPGILH